MVCLIQTLMIGVVLGGGPHEHLREGLAVREGARSLDGMWEVIPDPYDQGRLDYLSRVRENGYWVAAEPEYPGERIEYSFSDEHTLRVPGDWNTQDERFFFYEGVMWYHRSFEYEHDPEHPRVFVRFGAVNQQADVWLNGENIGAGHEVGFTPFHFEVTGLIREGENRLVVRVDNTRRADLVPAMITDWWNYGGITRSVHLIEHRETFIRDAHAHLKSDGWIEGWVALDGAGAGSQEVTLRIGGTDPVNIRAGDDGIAAFRIRADGLARWSAEQPVLHEFVVRFADDEFVDRIGLRTIEARGGDILLNGERVFLRGICIHEEALSRRGRSSGDQDARELLGLAKELGCNYVRLAHYPHDESMLRVADELGLMVWAEIPVYWEMEYRNPRTLEMARTHLREMIARDHNRASVIIWSVGNETGDDSAKTKFRTELGKYVKSLDPTRLLSAAMWARQIRDSDGKLTTLRVDDPFGEIADVLAINEYVGWYHDAPEDILVVGVELDWDKPFLISETGAGVKRGLRGESDAVWTEEFGVRFYKSQLEWIFGLDNCDGVSPWILKDFLSPRRPLYGIQDWYNRKGLVSERGVKKDVFFIVQEMYETREE